MSNIPDQVREPETEHPGDDFGRFMDAGARIKEILGKHGLRPENLRLICRDCPDLHSSVMQQKLSSQFNLTPAESAELCSLCKELDLLRLNAGLY